jgi:hypothetical protein
MSKDLGCEIAISKGEHLSPAAEKSPVLQPFCPHTIQKDLKLFLPVIPLVSLQAGVQHSKLIFPSVREKDKFSSTKNESNSK